MMGNTLMSRAEYAVVQRLRSLKGKGIFRSERPEYTKLPDDNLVLGVTRKDFSDDLTEGDGN